MFIEGVVAAKMLTDGGAVATSALSIIATSSLTSAAVTPLSVSALPTPPKLNPRVESVSCCSPESASLDCALPAIAVSLPPQ